MDLNVRCLESSSTEKSIHLLVLLIKALLTY